jgi:excinuclease ABC subunit C
MTVSAELRASLLEKIARFPTTPGVYIMKDRRSQILYIGKAVNLRSRVRSYFGGGSDGRMLTRYLVERVADVACVVTASETEALILENNLIKKHRPLCNIRLRDDKNYVCLKVTLEEEWPRVLITRRYRRDGNLYFGPYGRAHAVREMLRVVKKLFPLRTCSNGFFKGRKRPCLEYDLGRCSAPCVDRIPRQKYLEDVGEVVLFLRGRNTELLEILEKKMLRASEQHRFELAARYRDQIRAIEKVFEVQKAQTVGQGDIDVFAHVREGESIGIQELVVRDDKIVNAHCHTFRNSLETEEILASFLSQYYLEGRYVPRHILCDTDFPDRGILEGWLRDQRGGAVEISVPRRGPRARLIEMARANAVTDFDVARTRSEKLHGTLVALQRALGLAQPPQRIECYDISNFQGHLAVGSMVVFEGGRPEKSLYRKFRVRTVEGADDFRMMREVLTRRFRSREERAGARKPDPLPDLLVVDGGKGQLNVAVEVLRELGIGGIGAIGLAKERRGRGTTERVFVPGRPAPLDLTQDTSESLLLQAIRDEAHRFAVSYHRQLRRKATLATGLEGIAGVGARRREKLLAAFGTVKAIEAAPEDRLAEVVGATAAAAVRRHFDEQRAVTKRTPSPPRPGSRRARRSSSDA